MLRGGGQSELQRCPATFALARRTASHHNASRHDRHAPHMTFIDAVLASPIASLFGFIGMAMGIGWTLFRTRTHILLAQFGAAAGFMVHYAMLGAWTAAAMVMLAALQAIAAIPLGSRPGFRYIYLATLPLIAAGVALTWQGAPSIFAALGLTFISLGRYQVRIVPFRALQMCMYPCWFVHNLMVMSVPALVSDVISCATGSWMLVKSIREERAATQVPAAACCSAQ
jgi:hypothetical protein